MNKWQVESLLADFDVNAIQALTGAMRRVLDRPRATWNELIVAANFDQARAELLRSGDQTALDQLLTELNELRTIATG